MAVRMWQLESTWFGSGGKTMVASSLVQVHATHILSSCAEILLRVFSDHLHIVYGSKKSTGP